MRFSLRELKETSSLEFTYDFTPHLSRVVDILSIEPAHILCDIRWIKGDLLIDVHLNCQMELACSKTLKPVPYQMNMNAEILFGDSEECDYPLSDPLEITDILFGYIVSEKPYTIYHPDAMKTSFDQERSSHPAFADLDKTYKK
ncbi:MAG: hypothetical protein WC992_01300 [Acholeplasmataceae bacterium]|jgi:uncharacterized protein|nr:hypothetical protein [Acholeplasmataceae bacterium]